MHRLEESGYLTFGENKHRFIVSLPEPSCNNPRKGFVAVFKVNHQHLVISKAITFYYFDGVIDAL